MPNPGGYIYSEQIIGALDPSACIQCTARMPQPGINQICSSCTEHLSTDPAQQFLYSKVLELYTFFVAVQRRSLTANFFVDHALTDKGIESQLWFEDGVPGIRATIPIVKELYWIDEVTGQQKHMLLTYLQQQLMEQVLLSFVQCHIALLMMEGVMRKELEWEGEEYIKEIEEIDFRPNHPGCTWHWTYCVTMQDGRSFAVNFTDRQLGWPQLVQPWEEYAKLGYGIDEPGGFDLGTKADSIKEDVNWEDCFLPSSDSEDECSYSDCNLFDAEIEVRKAEEWGIPSWDVITDEAPTGWEPKVSASEAKEATLMLKIDHAKYMTEYLEMWREGEWA